MATNPEMMPIPPPEDPTMPGGPQFDVHNQPIKIYYPDGTWLDLALSDFNKASWPAFHLVAIFAAQIGASIILFILVAILTKPQNRRTLLFGVNLLALALVIIRSFLQISYFMGPWYDAYSYMAWDWEDVPMGDRITSVAASCGALALQATVEVSLLLQMKVVFANKPGWRTPILTACGTLAAVAVAFFAVATVHNARWVLAAQTPADDWAYKVAKAVFAASIGLFSFIFVFKLGVAIKRRRALCDDRFDAIQIIFVMGCQTMTLPAIFLIIEHIVTFDGMGSLASAFIAWSLPLTSMWAAANTDERNAAAACNMNFYHKNFDTYTTTTENSIEKGPAVCGPHGSTHSRGVCVEKTYEVASRVAGFAMPTSTSSGKPVRDMYDLGDSEPSSPV